MTRDGKSSHFSVAVEDFLEDMWKKNPVDATAVGVHDFDEEMGEFSKSAIDDRIVWLKNQLARFEQMDLTRLTEAETEDLKLTIAWIRTQLLFMDDLGIFRISPVIYPELCVYACYLLCVREYAPIEERLNSVVRRLSKISGVLDEAKANLSNPPRIWVELAVETSEGAIGFMKGALASLFAQTPSLEKDFDKVSVQAVSAFDEFSRYLKEHLLESCSGSYAVGRDRFEFLLKEEHMLEFDADSLLEFGGYWIREAEKELREVAGQIDPNKNWSDIIDQYKGDHPEATRLLSFYREKIEKGKRFVMEKDLVRLPDEEYLDVVPTPDFERAFLPYAAYMPPAPFERQQKGLFFVSPVDDGLDEEQREQQLRGHNKYKATVTALHEAYPGHHLQLTVSNSHPSKIRRLYGDNVFVEGWALYCEEMMYEQRFYEDAITRLFQLKDTLWRACRVVLDVKLHLNLISFDQACNFLSERAGLEKVNAQKEVNRYTLSPTQPMSYLVGREEIRRLRESVKAMKPEVFNLKRFHDWLLSHGSVPVGLISAHSFFP